MEKEFKKNLIERFITSIAMIVPIVLVVTYKNVWLFSIIVSLTCIVGCYEWVKNNLQNRLLGMFIILNFGLTSIIFVTFLQNAVISPYIIFLAVIFNTAIFDSSAYIIGSNFGKNKIAINISPNKTYEGLVGGLIVSVLYSYSLCIFLNLDFIVIIFLFLGCFFAFFGDLFISYYKRKSGIKDTGHFLPGHGGVLDRLDSHLIATPLILLLFSIVL